MVRLLNRTEILKANYRVLYQQAAIGRVPVYTGTFPWTPTSEYNCYYCRYVHRFANLTDYNDCAIKHGCQGAQLPFINMNKPINDEVLGEYDNPDETVVAYHATGIYKQVTFEAQPHHVQLYLCNNGQARCNSACWWHAWRLANKRTVTQCGKTHLCQNDGSAWIQMSPNDPTLNAEFIQDL